MYRLAVLDPYTDELLTRAARLRDELRAEDDEFAWGWAA